MLDDDLTTELLHPWSFVPIFLNGQYTKFAAIVLLEHFIFAVKLLLMYGIDEVPLQVQQVNDIIGFKILYYFFFLS